MGIFQNLIGQEKTSLSNKSISEPIKFKIFQNLLKLNWAGNIEVWKEVATIGRQILKQRPVGNTDTQRHLNTG